MHGGHSHGPRPDGGGLLPDSLTSSQSESILDDGSIEITLTTGSLDFSFTRVVTLDQADDGSYSITQTRGNGEVTQVVSADTDGGVDVDITQTLPDGNTLTQHVELDVNSDGQLVVGIDFTAPDGTLTTHTHTVSLAAALGSADESLTVAEVTEVLLTHAGVDVTLTGVADLLASA